MACFLVPATEAIITTAITAVVKHNENKSEGKNADNGKIRFSKKLGWLNKMLWGGSALLAFEHVWHGEVIPTFPFLTAVKEGEAAAMLGEMATAGVCMAAIVTAVWVGMVIVSSAIEKRKASAVDAEETEASV